MDDRGCNCGLVCLGILQMFLCVLFVGYIWAIVTGVMTFVFVGYIWAIVTGVMTFVNAYGQL